MGEHQSTGRSPAKLLMGRNLKTGLNWLRPNVSYEMERSNIRQKVAHDEHSHMREFEIAQPVWVHNEINSGWREGVIKSRTGRYSYLVESKDRMVRKHADQLRKREVAKEMEKSGPGKENGENMESEREEENIKNKESDIVEILENVEDNGKLETRKSQRARKPTNRLIEEL
ncbi:uncharacterized protein LOC135926971 [Gordionus sp. m RMFG-2023]|uniref:uncharacterized protein LOC135926971 n=1 Tax=Gordionus sp. m RMFG-2023 TaxID=3053472 RepID=UPI0031FD957F